MGDLSRSSKSKLNVNSCWLGYGRLEKTPRFLDNKKWCVNVVVPEDSPLIASAVNEMKLGFKGMFGVNARISAAPQQAFFITVGTLGKSLLIDGAVGTDEKERMKEEGFILKAVQEDEKNYILVAGKTGKGVLYGTFCLLRLLSCGESLEGIYRVENPKNTLRIINEWDNMDGSIERGYAGESIFYRNNKIVKDLRRVQTYARLLSSVGINGIVINNVNVKKYETRLITAEYLPDVARVADVFRAYGIKVFLSINFASPIHLGKLHTADPLDPDVRAWWKQKTAEIYEYINDFGGFLVKADSEFNPGPYMYHRDHDDGANMLAEALAPFGGLVIWRCFVYNCTQDWRDRVTDRARAAYDNFKPLDGKFHKNVVLQIKNGPMDFQVREPVSPLFGGLQNTNQMIELQIAQEYTGQQRHLCYLVPQWKEVLEFDTYAKGAGSKVKKIVDGSLYGNEYNGFAAVSNIGNDANWTGHDLAQANLYGYGRLAWDSDLSAGQIADEWIRMTYSNDIRIVNTISEMLMSSWSIYENYTTPLGIGWMVNPSHHYGPSVDGYEYSKWGTYHRADCHGIGVDRSVASGTGYAGQYHKENAEMYESPETCPEELLLFFHHIPYTYRLKSGKTLIQHIYDTHFEGVEQAVGLKEKWMGLKGLIDAERYEHVLERLEEQIEHAKEWRDVINSYFYRKSGIEDEKGRKIY